MRRVAAGAAALTLLAGCGGGSGGKTTTVTRVSQPQTQTTKVEVLRSAPAQGGAFNPQGIYKTESPGVVTLIAIGRGAALGSGFVVDGNGYVATNAHVVTGDSGARAKRVFVQFADGNEVPARIIGTDPDSDVALIKVDPAALRGPNAKLVPLPLGSTSELQVGDPVAAIGSPFGEQQSLSTGVVSALNRDIESLTKFSIGNAIQTDAAINHGNSGGPLLDGSGKVIGINAQIQSSSGGGEGVGFAIPVETVKHSLDQLRAQGHVAYPYLGISSVTLYPQLAARLGVKRIDGALLDKVYPGGPADKAGLHGASSHITFQAEPQIPVGSDLVVAVNGHPVKASQDISNAIAPLKPGAVVKLRVLRGGKVITLNATLGTRPESAQAR